MTGSMHTHSTSGSWDNELGTLERVDIGGGRHYYAPPIDQEKAAKEWADLGLPVGPNATFVRPITIYGSETAPVDYSTSESTGTSERPRRVPIRMPSWKIGRMQ